MMLKATQFYSSRLINTCLFVFISDHEIGYCKLLSIVIALITDEPQK